METTKIFNLIESDEKKEEILKLIENNIEEWIVYLAKESSNYCRNAIRQKNINGVDITRLYLRLNAIIKHTEETKTILERIKDE